MAKRKKDAGRVRYETHEDVLGRLAAEGLVFGKEPAVPFREPVSVAAVLAAAEREPEILAALPALIWRRPGVFTSVRGLPGDLAAAVSALKYDGQPRYAGYGPAELRSWAKKLDRATS